MEKKNIHVKKEQARKEVHSLAQQFRGSKLMERLFGPIPPSWRCGLLYSYLLLLINKVMFATHGRN